MAGAATILHADLDSFYASVEQHLDPTLRNRAMAVGTNVILAASYEAKRFGVAGGMATWRARERCPELLVLPGHFDQYRRYSTAVMDILGSFTPAIHQVSIDEAFLDVRGSERLFGPPPTIAQEIRRRVRDEVGLAVSVGVASTKHLAKIASQVAKPDGMLVVAAGDELTFLEPLPIRLVWGIGPATERRLIDSGIRTIGDLARRSPERLASLVGDAAGHRLHALATNNDPRDVEPPAAQRSIGAQSAFPRTAPTADHLTEVLGHLADRVSSRMRAQHLAGRRISVRVRFLKMRAVTRSLTVDEPVCTTLTLTEIARSLVEQALHDNPDEHLITLLAVSVSRLDDEGAVQGQLPMDAAGDDPQQPGSARGTARREVDRSMDAVRERFGRRAVGYASAARDTDSTAPDTFRDLAQRRSPDAAKRDPSSSP